MSKMQGLSVRLPLAYSNQDGPYGLNKNLQQVVEQNLKNLILTSPGERVMLPSFGVGARRFLFGQMSGPSFSELSNKIYQQVRTYMPFVIIEDIKVLNSDVDISLSANEVRLVVQYNIGSLAGSNTLQISQVND